MRSQDWPRDCLEIVYVDDASTDGSVEIASEFAESIVRLAGFPSGPAGARNAGVRASSGEIIVFIDADVVAPPGTIQALVRPLMEDDNLDAIFGSYDSDPLSQTIVSQYRNLLHHFVHQTSRRNAATFWAGCGAIRRRSFDIAGGFDAERYRRAMIEDIELGRRMCALGMQIKLQPSIQVKHLKEWTLFQMVKADIFSRGVPWVRLLFQDTQAPRELGDLNLKLSGFLSTTLAWLGALMLFPALWFPKSIFGAFLAFGMVLVMNLPTYRFFYKIRGLQFALMTIPLNMLYHLYNGASFIGGLLYRCLIDQPLPGLKSIGASLQVRHRRYIDQRLKKGNSPPLPERGDQPVADHLPGIDGH
jgi:glycosyltransferase involved in cell wall biosynthesis